MDSKQNNFERDEHAMNFKHTGSIYTERGAVYLMAVSLQYVERNTWGR
jgi:hypothetical protein